ncbi:MAG TPA: His/Gly/Thr/Pro-type tRNA ligase C-terminal domain-containing protein, partial [Actinomycetota bacterium]
EALGGPRVPGVGFGMGLERVSLALEDEGLAPPEEPVLEAFVVSFAEGGRAKARDLLRLLRAAGVAADAAFEERPLGAQLKMANRARARWAVIVGEEEAAAGTITLRRLADGSQETVPQTEVIDRIRRKDG